MLPLLVRQRLVPAPAVALEPLFLRRRLEARGCRQALEEPPVALLVFRRRSVLSAAWASSGVASTPTVSPFASPAARSLSSTQAKTCLGVSRSRRWRGRHSGEWSGGDSWSP